jgi:ribonuclease Z
LALKRGSWLRKLKKYGKVRIKGMEVKLEEVARIKKGLKVVYTGDTKPCDNVIRIARNSDLLIHDSTFLEEEEGKAHADVKQAAQVAKAAEVKELILTHISRRYKDASILEKEARKVFPNTKVAYDFMRIKLK